MIRLRQLLAQETGYSLIEMLLVMIMMTVVLAGITDLFVTGSNAELDMNARYQAQTAARLSLDKLRREVHCASVVSPAGASTSVTITLPAQCPTAPSGGGNVYWCALQVPGAPAGQYGLYRTTTSPCATSGVKWADYLTSQNVFTFSVQSTSSLGSLAVDLKLNNKPKLTQEVFNLKDDLVLRNSTRTCIAGSPVPPC